MAEQRRQWIDVAVAFGLVVMVAGVYGYDAFVEQAPSHSNGLPADASNSTPTTLLANTAADSEVAKPQPQTVAENGLQTSTPAQPPIPDDIATQIPPPVDVASKPNMVPDVAAKPVPDVAAPPKTVPDVASKPVPETAAPKRDLEWTLERGQTIFQVVAVQQNSNFNVQGIQQATNLQYRVLSKFDVLSREANGTRKLRQTILGVTLDQADPLVRTTIGPAANAMKGRVFEIDLAANMDVTRFSGQNAAPQVSPVAGLGQQAFMMASLIDTDGWKELAQVTFFQPTVAVSKQPTWQRDMRHDWGALGHWAGKTHFKFEGPMGDLMNFSYQHQMAYSPPNANAGGVNGLPLKISGAQMQPQKAAGTIAFDNKLGRVTKASEQFHVQGVLNATLLGQNVQIGLVERQGFTITVTDTNPWPIQPGAVN